MIFQKVASGYLLHFVQNGSSNKYKNTHVCTTISKKRHLHGPASIWEHNKNVKLWQYQFYKNTYRRILFQKVALDYLLHFVQNGSSKHILKTRFVHNNLKIWKIHGPASIWEHQNNIMLWQNQFYIKSIGKSSSRKLRWVVYYTLYRMDPQKTC